MGARAAAAEALAAAADVAEAFDRVIAATGLYPGARGGEKVEVCTLSGAAVGMMLFTCAALDKPAPGILFRCAHETHEPLNGMCMCLCV